MSPALDTTAAWVWRLLLVAAAGYLLVRLMDRLTLLVVSTFVALLLAALLHRPVAWLRRLRLGRSLSALAILLLALTVGGVAGYLLITHIGAQAEELTSQLSGLLDRVKSFLQRLPGVGRLPQDLQNQVLAWIENHRAQVAGGLLTTGRMLLDVATIVVLALFLAFFFLAEGERIWAWLLSLLPRQAQATLNGAGHRGWSVLTGWLTGTAVVATVHGIVIGAVLWLLGTPLVVPLAVLVFLGSFVPLVGALLFGGLAVLVTLLAQGFWPALILLAVLVAENHLEGYVLQPLIVGHAVRLHPVAIVVVLTGAGLLGGLVGAIFAIPLVAAVHAAVKYVVGVEDVHGRRLENQMRPLPVPETAPHRRPSAERPVGQ